MKAAEHETIRFVALFPHRDVARRLEKVQSVVFSFGLPGAYSFPLCAPLCFPSTPMKRSELRAKAIEIRKKQTSTGQADGYASLGHPVVLENAAILAHRILVCPLELNGLEVPYGMIIGATDSATEAKSVLTAAGDEIRAFFPLRFRAAFLSNVLLRPAEMAPQTEGNLSMEWACGEPVWLPSAGKGNHVDKNE